MPTIEQLIDHIREAYHLTLTERHAKVILEHLDQAEQVMVIGMDSISGERKTISVPSSEIRALGSARET